MKYKKMLEYLKNRQKWHDNLPEREKQSRKRPGSVKVR